MTSACINTPFSPENFLHHLPPPYSALTPPTPLQMHHQQHDSTGDNNNSNHIIIPSQDKQSDLTEEHDLEASDGVDFEFRLEQPVDMLPADQLFSDGKLFPMNFPLAVVHEASSSSSSSCSSSSVEVSESLGVRSTDPPESNRIINGVAVVDSFLYASKAPKCSSKWKELLGLRKLYHNSSNASATTTTTATASSPASGNTAIKSIKHFLYRSSKSSTDPSVSLPLLNDTDNEPPVVPSRHSLSSSSSGHDPEELPRLSLDSEKTLKVNMNTNPNPNNPPRMKLVKTRTLSSDGSIRAVSTESPRMNSSGKIVFHSLERSSSSPSSFNGGHRSKHRGIERSYSGNVRITPVLNVPVYSLRGFPLFSSSQKHEGSSSSSNYNSSNNNNINRGGSRNQQMNNKSKTDRS